MKTLMVGILLLLCTTTHAAVTNELHPADLFSRGFPSDYGDFTLTVRDIESAPRWDGHGDPPTSISQAISSVRIHLPLIDEDSWILNNIGLENFDGKGWYYLVVFENHSTFTKGQLHYVVIKKYIAAVLMDSRVLIPSEKENDDLVEQLRD
jgi:hypothetical protein